jgi:hypothetical protein
MWFQYNKVDWHGLVNNITFLGIVCLQRILPCLGRTGTWTTYYTGGDSDIQTTSSHQSIHLTVYKFS